MNMDVCVNCGSAFKKREKGYKRFSLEKQIPTTGKPARYYLECIAQISVTPADKKTNAKFLCAVCWSSLNDTVKYKKAISDLFESTSEQSYVAVQRSLAEGSSSSPSRKKPRFTSTPLQADEDRNHPLHRVTVYNALLFLEDVILKYSETPDVVRQLLEILSKWRLRMYEIKTVISKIEELFNSDKDLLIAFNVFLPKHYHFEDETNKGNDDVPAGTKSVGPENMVVTGNLPNLLQNEGHSKSLESKQETKSQGVNKLTSKKKLVNSAKTGKRKESQPENVINGLETKRKEGDKELPVLFDNFFVGKDEKGNRVLKNLKLDKWTRISYNSATGCHTHEIDKEIEFWMAKQRGKDLGFSLTSGSNEQGCFIKKIHGSPASEGYATIDGKFRKLQEGDRLLKVNEHVVAYLSISKTEQQILDQDGLVSLRVCRCDNPSEKESPKLTSNSRSEESYKYLKHQLNQKSQSEDSSGRHKIAHELSGAKFEKEIVANEVENETGTKGVKSCDMEVDRMVVGPRINLETFVLDHPYTRNFVNPEPFQLSSVDQMKEGPASVDIPSTLPSSDFLQAIQMKMTKFKVPDIDDTGQDGKHGQPVSSLSSKQSDAKPGQPVASGSSKQSNSEPGQPVSSGSSKQSDAKPGQPVSSVSSKQSDAKPGQPVSSVSSKQSDAKPGQPVASGSSKQSNSKSGQPVSSGSSKQANNKPGQPVSSGNSRQSDDKPQKRPHNEELKPTRTSLRLTNKAQRYKLQEKRDDEPVPKKKRKLKTPVPKKKLKTVRPSRENPNNCCVHCYKLFQPSSVRITMAEYLKTNSGQNKVLLGTFIKFETGARLIKPEWCVCQVCYMTCERIQANREQFVRSKECLETAQNEFKKRENLKALLYLPGKIQCQAEKQSVFSDQNIDKYNAESATRSEIMYAMKKIWRESKTKQVHGFRKTCHRLLQGSQYYSLFLNLVKSSKQAKSSFLEGVKKVIRQEILEYMTSHTNGSSVLECKTLADLEKFSWNGVMEEFSALPYFSGVLKAMLTKNKMSEMKIISQDPATIQQEYGKAFGVLVSVLFSFRKSRYKAFKVCNSIQMFDGNSNQRLFSMFSNVGFCCSKKETYQLLGKWKSEKFGIQETPRQQKTEADTAAEDMEVPYMYDITGETLQHRSDDEQEQNLNEKGEMKDNDEQTIDSDEQTIDNEEQTTDNDEHTIDNEELGAMQLFEASSGLIMECVNVGSEEQLYEAEATGQSFTGYEQYSYNSIQEEKENSGLIRHDAKTVAIVSGVKHAADHEVNTDHSEEDKGTIQSIQNDGAVEIGDDSQENTELHTLDEWLKIFASKA